MMRLGYSKKGSDTENQGSGVTYMGKGVKVGWLCVCVFWLVMTTLPWCRERVLVYYYSFVSFIIIYWCPLCKAGREWEHFISPKTQTPHNQPMEGRKSKTVGNKKERAVHANRKALALLWKPASPTPSNTGSLRSFQRDTERGTKRLRYWEVLQRGGSNECLWATKARRVTRAGRYGKSNAPLRDRQTL